MEVVARTGQIVRDAESVGLLRADADVEETTEVLGAIFSGVISQQLSNEPGVAATSGRISRHATAFAQLFLSRYGA